jgi:histidine ammonia-lyase
MAAASRKVRIALQGPELALGPLRGALRSPARVALGQREWRRVRRSALTIERVVARGKTVYGVNTGFGLLAQTQIPSGELELLQRNRCCRTPRAPARCWRMRSCGWCWC